jgi:hypothetical protein
MTTMTAAGPRVTPASRIRFVPFTVLHRADKVLIGRADGSEWLELDAAGGQAMLDLDEGYRLGQVQQRLLTGLGEQVDIAAFVDGLASLGFVAGVDGEHSSSRIARPPAPVRPSWPWVAILMLTAATAGYGGWLVASHQVALPRGSDLLLPHMPLPVALIVALLTGAGLMTVHELAHLLVGRYYGLSPHIGLGRRGVWLVAQADLTGVHALDRSLQWRPIAAGPMADLLIFSLSIVLLYVGGDEAGFAPIARLLAAIAAVQLLWQLQWYLRTDVYFMFAVLTRTTALRRNAWRSATHLARPWREPAGKAMPEHERVAARVYVLSLPVALLATYLMWQWVLLPFARELVPR